MTGPEVTVILQARVGSTRLPAKILAILGGMTVLERCVRRLQAARVGPVVVATTLLPEDDATARVAAALGAPVVRGPVDDVLARYGQAADAWPAPFVIRATADNPLVDIGACWRVLEHLRRGADYVVESGLPVGAAVEGMTTAALRTAARHATEAYDREHVTPWLYRAVHDLRVLAPDAPASLVRPELRFTLDTPADLTFLRGLVAEAGARPLTPLASLLAAADRLALGASA